jgi:DNA integrity scanning protein DisA with diadenylate cyclase activity
MIHITCTAHGLHRVAEEVRGTFSTVDKVISSVKKTFRKAPNCVQIFKNKASYLNLPSEPIITRWGTWINASNYYCEHLDVIRKIIEKLDVDDAVSIKEAKKYIFKNGIERDLAYIKSNFSILTISFTKLQKQELPLTDAINL